MFGKRMNVLLIMADQMRADCIEAVNPNIKTPNLQKLVESGILFERAYPPTPVCLPCRTSILTGKYPSTIGTTHNYCSLDLSYPHTIAREFDKAGYYTHIIGKSHFNPVHGKDSPEAPPQIFDRDFYRNWKGPHFGFKRADICVGHTTESIACSMHYGAWLEDKGVDISKYFGNTSYTAHEPWSLPEEFHSSKWISEVTIEALEHCSKNKIPFFLWVNFPDPHNPCMVPEPWASMYSPEEIPVHGFKKGEPDSFNDKPSFYKEIIDHPGAYSARISDPDLPGSGNVSSLPWDIDEVQDNAARYYGMISLMDKYIGVILDKLKELGLADDTLVVFCSDHGDLLGDHGMFWKGLVSFEECMRVPLIISCPGILPTNKRTSALHGLIDLPPTFLSFAGLEKPSWLEGIDQLETWKDPDN
ncbi:MAG: sulfatase-like hydrolase/transferase, partial [Promethearchaeota archaeon]